MIAKKGPSSLENQFKDIVIKDGVLTATHR